MILNTFLTKFGYCRGKLITIKQKEKNFVKISVKALKMNMGLLDLTFFSDEAHCHLSGHINKQNMCFWAQAYPMNINISFLAKRKSLCVVRQDEITSSGHTSLSTRMRIGDWGHRPLHCTHADEVNSCTEEKNGSRY